MYAGIKRKDISVTIPEGCREGTFDLKLNASLFDPQNQTESETQNAVAADDMMQAFYYHHNIPAAGLTLEVTPKAPFRIEFPMDLYSNGGYQVPFAEGDTILSIPVKIRRNADFKETIELSVYPKNRGISMAAVNVLPGETDKTVTISIRARDILKQKKLRYGISIVGMVNGEVEQRGKRAFENAAYREMSPLIVITRD